MGYAEEPSSSDRLEVKLDTGRVVRIPCSTDRAAVDAAIQDLRDEGLRPASYALVAKEGRVIEAGVVR